MHKFKLGDKVEYSAVYSTTRSSIGVDVTKTDKIKIDLPNTKIGIIAGFRSLPTGEVVHDYEDGPIFKRTGTTPAYIIYYDINRSPDKVPVDCIQMYDPTNNPHTIFSPCQ